MAGPRARVSGCRGAAQRLPRRSGRRLHLGAGYADTAVMPTGALRDVPRVAWAFVALYLGSGIYSLSMPHHFPHRLGVAIVVGGAVLALNLLWLGAMLIWRQAWAWWLYLVVVVSTMLQRLFGVHDGGTVALWIADLVLIGLLVSPEMRRFVGVRGRPARAA